MDVAAQIRVDPALPATLAQQVREQLTWLISRGVVVAGDELPSVRSLAADLGINYHTVRSAYRRLEADGLVETRRGRRSRIARFDPRHLWPPETAARTHLVGVVVPSLGPFYVELLEGALDAARSAGMLLIVATTDDDQAAGAPGDCPAGGEGRGRCRRRLARHLRTSSRAARRSRPGASCLWSRSTDRARPASRSKPTSREPATWPRGISWRTVTGRSASSPTRPPCRTWCRSRPGTGAPLPRQACLPTSDTWSVSAPGASRRGAAAADRLLAGTGRPTALRGDRGSPRDRGDAAASACRPPRPGGRRRGGHRRQPARRPRRSPADQRGPAGAGHGRGGGDGSPGSVG